jgi:hypothetical protein
MGMTAQNTDNQQRKLAHYFEYSRSGVEVVQDGLEEITFGEFLVEEKAITRTQLFDALQLQDKMTGKRIGECVAALGYMTYPEIERYLQMWNSLDVVLV